MIDIQIKQLKDNLWHSADLLRQGAHLAANKYGQPILGLVFLRYADVLFKQHKDEILSEYESLKGGRREKFIKEISIEKIIIVDPLNLFLKICKEGGEIIYLCQLSYQNSRKS